MNRIARGAMVFAMFLTLAAGTVFAQGSRSLMEMKAWYVDGNGKVAEALYWRIVMGDYNMKIKRNFPGEGQITVDASIGFQFLSSGYIEGNGQSAKGKVQSLPGMRIRVEGKTDEIKLDEIDYIYDYGTKVVAKDGRRGDFLIGAEGQNLEVKRFQMSEFKMVKGSFGELELKEAFDRKPIIGLSFTKEGAAKAAKEPVTD